MADVDEIKRRLEIVEKRQEEDHDFVVSIGRYFKNGWPSRIENDLKAIREDLSCEKEIRAKVVSQLEHMQASPMKTLTMVKIVAGVVTIAGAVFGAMFAMLQITGVI